MQALITWLSSWNDNFALQRQILLSNVFGNGAAVFSFRKEFSTVMPDNKNKMPVGAILHQGTTMEGNDMCKCIQIGGGLKLGSCSSRPEHATLGSTTIQTHSFINPKLSPPLTSAK